MSEQMHEEFEAWVKSLSPNRYLSTERFSPLHGVTEGEYKGFTVQCCWESFQAARKTGFTAVDMGTASADGRRSLAEHLIKQITIEHPDQDTLLTVGHIAQWIALETGL